MAGNVVSRLSGANETGTVLLLLIIAVWFFTSARFTAFKKVLTSPFKVQSITASSVAGQNEPGATVISGGDDPDHDPNANVG